MCTLLNKVYYTPCNLTVVINIEYIYNHSLVITPVALLTPHYPMRFTPSLPDQASRRRHIDSCW